ncbi:unnamed protein product [Closterium sp. Yama58-4]|nr:unnamed protein product [Closterium sp. Yama58-4]
MLQEGNLSGGHIAAVPYAVRADPILLQREATRGDAGEAGGGAEALCGAPFRVLHLVTDDCTCHRKPLEVTTLSAPYMSGRLQQSSLR